MRDSDKILQTSGKITLAFLAFVLMLLGWIGDVFSYGTQSGTLLDLRRGSRVTDYMFHQPLVDTYTFYFGTQSVTGSGTAGYITGTSTALPRLQYNASALTFNFVGATLQNEGVDVTVDSDLSGYIAVTGGTGTGNVLTNTTLDGTGTISANIALTGNITANSLEITPTELSCINNASGELQAQITTVTGSITNHMHTGTDGTTQISHDSITGTGTNSHADIDTFIASKAQASGIASLDTSSLVVQNPASASATPGASKIVLADGVGLISDGWLSTTITKLGGTIELGTETTGNTDNVSEGSTNKYYTDARVNTAVSSLGINTLSDVVITSPAEGHRLGYSSGNWVNATDTAVVDWSGITGVPTDNGSITVSSAANTIPIRDADENLFAAGIVGGTTTGALRIPSGTTAQRPASPEIGMIRMASVDTYYAASGGTITTSGTYTVHTFTASGSFVSGGTYTTYNMEFYNGEAWSIAGTGTSILLSTDEVATEYLLVAGGGGGGGGGGGAGGMKEYNVMLAPNSTLVVTVGAGGAAFANGNDTSIGTITASGGGRGAWGGATPYGAAGSGGSGGGGVSNVYLSGGAGVEGEGNNGGVGVAVSPYPFGGGGGKGAVGADGSGSQSGAGGIGKQSNISGGSTYYAGGGGGGASNEGATSGAGGNGGGGAGATTGGGAGSAGTANTGGGGGGSGKQSGAYGGGIGGSGIVIIRYPTP